MPPELPETQLAELAEYAMSFVKRNESDLLDTLLDINQTIFKEYAYTQGATTVYTTPFEVYANRKGVCQDFTNVMICLARLLGVPGRGLDRASSAELLPRLRALSELAG